MQDFGFVRIAAAMPHVHVADCRANARETVALARELSSRGAGIIAFPELGVTGYTCADLFGQGVLTRDAEAAVAGILEETSDLPAVLVFGAPVRFRGRLFNCAVASCHGKILGIVPKTYLAGSAEFYEPRWFESARVLPPEGADIDYAGQKDIPFKANQLFRSEDGSLTFAVEICQDLWAPVPPCSFAALAGAQLIVNLSASNEVLLKHEYRKSLVSATSSRLFCAYLYCSCGYGESTQDLVWAGSSLICEYGSIIAESERFKTGSGHIMADIDVEKLEALRTKEHAFRLEAPRPAFSTVTFPAPPAADFGSVLLRRIDPRPFVPSDRPEELDLRCREIISSQVAGLATRLDHIRCRKAVIGVSGGLDSTLALLVTVLAFDTLGIPRDNVLGITMPGFGTTKRTHDNSTALMSLLGASSREISIVPAVRQHFSDIGQDESVHDLSYENSQARERTQLLMDIAGKEGGIVIGTGDLSELALGWCTYNGDHMSMYAVNVSIPKTLVKTLVLWAADNRFKDNPEAASVLRDIADTPISPELIPADENGQISQKTEDLIGPYELHDFFLYNFFRWGYGPAKLLFLARKAFGDSYDEATLRKWLGNFMKRFFSQQFKRSCIPDGPKVGSVSLSPRGDWRMPSDIACPWKADM
ncbi:MAG TPA: NAD(+) synthase [Candidatus Cryptobacteroides pullicola]|nr:NAD(+) synthase [Candidatus Cryptobacteroides pullicola]